MKILLLLLPALFCISSCALKIDQAKAQHMVESMLNDLNNDNYTQLNNYYTASFNESEPLEQKIEKFKRLKETMGAIQSYELVSAKENYDSDRGINQLELKYKVKCSKVTVMETFLIINDEGNERIIFQNIENAVK